jgi:hypothetical protein
MSTDIAPPSAITTTTATAAAPPSNPSSAASNSACRQMPDRCGAWTQTFSPKTLESALKPALLAARADEAPKDFESAFNSAPITRQFNNGDTTRSFEGRNASTSITQHRD